MDRRYTNQANVPLSMAVFLATDNYDSEDHTISATTFLKATRQIVLSQRVPEELSLTELTGLVKSRMGSAIHDAIERAWLDNPQKAMSALGYPKRVTERVVVNPDPSTVTEDQIPVYLELRSYKEIMGYTVSGKFDFVAEGRVEDFKSTGTFTWTSKNKEEDYKIQGSIYRWLNPDIIKDDHIAIRFIFTDWMAAKAKADPNYPQAPIATKLIPLMSLTETEMFITNKLKELEAAEKMSEKDIPLCSDRELWRTDPVFKYYKNPAKMTRSTKNFTTSFDAYKRLADEGAGVVIEVPGEAIACKYCSAFPVCTQKDSLIADGSLKI